MHRRTIVLVLLVLATAGYTRFLSDVHAVPLRKPLTSVPLRIGEWTGIPSKLEERIVQVVGVEDYLLRTYRAPDGFSVSVYVGYYERQGEGDQIHSPRHCLPGAGWRPVASRVREFETPGLNGGLTRANQVVIQKGEERQLVLYWYQSRGRNITNEYWAKVWLVVDSIFRKRNDGALVRFIADVPPDADPEGVARRAEGFVREFLPFLQEAFPT